MQLTGETVTFLMALGVILATLAAGLLYLERRQNRRDEVAEWRRTVDAMRRIEQQEGDR